MKGESKGAYRAFVDVALSDLSQRQLLARYQEQAVSESLTRPPTLSGKTIARWSVDFKWQERLKLWRSRFNQLKLEQRLKRWDEFCDKLEERAGELIDRADQLMKHPPVERKVTKKIIAEFAGQEIEQEIIVKPARWAAKDIPLYYDEASKIMKMVVGEIAIAIDLVTRQGYVVTDPTADNDSENDNY